MDHCVNEKTRLDPETYRIKKTYTDLLFENRKRKYNDLYLNSTKSVETPNRKRKVAGNARHIKGTLVVKLAPFRTPNFSKENSSKAESENLNVKSILNVMSKNKDFSPNSTANKKEISVFGNNLRYFDDSTIEKNKENLLTKPQKKLTNQNESTSVLGENEENRNKFLREGNLNRKGQNKTQDRLKSKKMSRSKTNIAKSHSKNQVSSLNLSMKKMLMINSPKERRRKLSLRRELSTLQKSINSKNLTKVMETKKITKKNLSIASVNLKDTEKSALTRLITKDKEKDIMFKFLGDSFKDIEECDLLIAKGAEMKDLKLVFCHLLNEKLVEGSNYNTEKKAILDYSWVVQSKEKGKLLPFENFIIESNKLDIKELKELSKNRESPFSGFRFYLHPSCYQTTFITSSKNEERTKLNILAAVVKLLGGTTVDNIRISDFSVMNKVDNTIHFPPHVKKVNDAFLLESLSHRKLQDFENFRYHPKDIKKYRK